MFPPKMRSPSSPAPSVSLLSSFPRPFSQHHARCLQASCEIMTSPSSLCQHEVGPSLSRSHSTGGRFQDSGTCTSLLVPESLDTTRTRRADSVLDTQQTREEGGREGRTQSPSSFSWRCNGGGSWPFPRARLHRVGAEWGVGGVCPRRLLLLLPPSPQFTRTSFLSQTFIVNFGYFSGSHAEGELRVCWL